MKHLKAVFFVRDFTGNPRYGNGKATAGQNDH